MIGVAYAQMRPCTHGRVYRPGQVALAIFASGVLAACGRVAESSSDTETADGARVDAAVLEGATPDAATPEADTLVMGCGGNVVGKWAFIKEMNFAPTTLPSVDDCWNLVVAPDGSVSVPSRVNVGAAPFVSGLLSFLESGQYVGATIYEGPITQHYPAKCLMAGSSQVACSDLDMPLTETGLGEGSWRKAVCAPAPNGGCDCTFSVMAVSGPAGTWSYHPDGRRLTMTQPGISGPTSEDRAYCVEADTLRIEGSKPAGHVFRRVVCNDGKRGFGEDGADCGWPCDNACP